MMQGPPPPMPMPGQMMPPPGMPPVGGQLPLPLDLLPPPPPPLFLDEQKLRQYAVIDQAAWNRRNARLLRHRRLYELTKPPKNKAKGGQRPSVTTDAKAIVHKIAAMFANHPPQISVASNDPQMTTAAERCADFLRSFRRKEIRRWGRGPHGNRAYDEAIYAVRDGIICELLAYNPGGSSWPFETSLLDPATVYPVYAGDKLIRCTIKYRTTMAEAQDLCQKLGRPEIVGDSTVSLRTEQLPVEITKVFSCEGGSWEVGILVRNQVLTVQALPYNPVLITYVNSRIYSSTIQGEMASTDRYELVGSGVFDVIEEAIKNKNEDYSMMREMMARDANPPRVIFTDDEGKLDDLEFEPGENVHLWAEDKFQLVQLTPDFRKLQALLQMDQQGIDRGSIPGALYGEGGDATSSAQEFMLLGNARDQVFVFQQALERHYEEKYARVLEMYRDGTEKMFPDSPAQGATFTQQTPNGIKLAGQEFSAADVTALGPEPEVEVAYSDITPQNEVARSQIAVNTVREKLLSLKSARALLPAPFNETPELENQLVLQDISLMHPMMTQIMAMTAAMYAPDPVMRSIAGLMLPQLIQQAQMQASAPPGGGPPGGPGGGPNPTPGQNGVPQRAGQMPPSANPAESGQNSGMPEGQHAVPPQGSQPQ